MKKLLLILFLFSQILAREPKLTVVFVVDQFAYHYLQKTYPHLTGGIKRLIDRGVLYTQAYFPHAQPGTATGHACINTGTLPNTHGIVSNKWCDHDGNAIDADDDPQSPVFKDHGFYDFGKSSRYLMVPGISHQATLSNHSVFSVSIKSRAAIMLAGDLGKAIWCENNKFTSSRAYFNQLPEWIEKINNKIKYGTWKTAYPKKSPAYNFENINNYEFSEQNPLVGTVINDKTFSKSPASIKALLRCAKSCVKKNLDKKLLLFISISTLDLAGHEYGPESMEVIDLIYHIDQQILKFIKCMRKFYSKKDVLYALTGDHGVMPFPELLAKKGVRSKRINANIIIDEINNFIFNKHGLENLIVNYRAPWFFLNHQLLDTSPNQQKIINDIKNFLKRYDFIKNVWSDDDLMNMSLPKHSIPHNFKTQLFPNRSGKISCLLYPYMQLTKYKLGADHASPYNYDTHVPLILSQPKTLKPKVIDKKVWMPQFAPTISKLLNIPKPVACEYEALPLS